MSTTEAPPSNVKSLTIFGGYMATALLLTLKSISIIRRQARLPPTTTGKATTGSNSTNISNVNLHTPAQRRRRVIIFSTLAAASLSMTWYYMFAFFAHSYRDWAAAHNVAVNGLSDLQLGPWLKDTSLFSLAWGSAMETDARVWWTQQIFGFCSIWTLILATEGSIRRIPSLYIFILLGQIVAISFASNLSFLAILLSPKHPLPSPPAKTGRARYDTPMIPLSSATLSAYFIVSATFAAVAATLPSNLTQNDKWFLPVLLAPHVLAFAPLWFCRARHDARQLVNPSLCALVMAILLQTKTTGDVLEQGGGLADILAAFHEHPAVSSVGWDVVLCWVSFTAWSILRD